MIKTLFAVLVGAAALAFASMTPASAETSTQKCLISDGVNHSIAYDVCRCVVVKIDMPTWRLLRPNAIKVASRCPFINNGGGGDGGPSDISDDTPPDHGHGFSISKASSSSGFVGIAIGGSTPIAVTLLGEHTKSVVLGDGAAAADAGSGGGAVATGSSPSQVARITTSTDSGSTSTTWGSSGGSSCAGSSCGGGGGSSTPE